MVRAHFTEADRVAACHDNVCEMRLDLHSSKPESALEVVPRMYVRNG